MDFSFLDTMTKEMRSLKNQMRKVGDELKQTYQMAQPLQFNHGNASDTSNCSYSVTKSQVCVEQSNRGKPRVYKESFMSRSGPGGVKEMKKVVCDEKGKREVCMGRALGEKAHVVRREEDQSGVIEEHEDLYNIDLDDISDLKQFHEAWERQKAKLPSYSDWTGKYLRND